jgi:hypothetical protein
MARGIKYDPVRGGTTITVTDDYARELMAGGFREPFSLRDRERHEGLFRSSIKDYIRGEPVRRFVSEEEVVKPFTPAFTPADLDTLRRAATAAGESIREMADSMKRAGLAMAHSPYTGTAGAATTETPISTAELLKKMKDATIKIEDDSVAVGDPSGWKLTSARWLAQNHPEFSGFRGGGAHDKLARALAAMSYLDAEAALHDGTLQPKEARALRDQKLAAWGGDEHAAMVAFLRDGGFSERMKALGKVEKALEVEGQKGKIIVNTSAPDLIIDPEAPQTPEQDLDEAVAHLANPARGSW